MQENYAQRAAVVIPAYKPDDRLPPYVQALKEAGCGKIVIVDDGSGESYQDLFASIVQDDTVHIISYSPNCGKGVALRRGIAYVKDECPEQDLLVTADSDGQHTVKDVLRLLCDLGENPEGVVLGSRDFSQSDVPPKSRMGNRITSCVFKVLYGQWICDTQTGLRGFARELFPLMLQSKGDRYEYEMNVLIDCATRRIPTRPITIETVYENNNEGSHFRAVRDSARIYSVIFMGFFRFISTSLISFGVDYGLYLLFNNLLKQWSGVLDREVHFLILTFVPHILLATVLARIISSITNFTLNRQFVFSDKGKIRKSFPRYVILTVVIMLLSAGLTSSCHVWFGWSDNIAKIPVDLLLFFLSYYIQRKWVFQSKGKKIAD